MKSHVTTALVAACLVLGGCSALTKYDYDFDGGTADSTIDVGDSSMDAPDPPDAPSDSATGDAGDGSGPLSPCPTPCFGDLAADARGGMQGTGMPRWRFLENERELQGLSFPELTWDGAEWSGTGAVISECDPAQCTDGDAVLLESTDWDATIELTVVVGGTYRIGGTYEAFGPEAQELLASRQGRNDALFLLPATGSDGLQTFSQEVSLVAGDHVRLTSRPGPGSASAEAALRLWIAGPAPSSSGTGDTCVVAVDFDDNPWEAQCGVVTPEADEITPTAPPPTREVSPIGFGDAVLIVADDDSYVRLDGADGPGGVDLTGDFTIQVWARFDDLSGAEFRTLWSNVPNDKAENGLFVDYRDDTGVELGAYDPNDNITASDFDPDPGVWHFIRVVRQGDEMALCIDGVRHAMTTAADDFTSLADFTLGFARGVGTHFDGAVDEFRVYTEALPCEVALP